MNQFRVNQKSLTVSSSPSSFFLKRMEAFEKQAKKLITEFGKQTMNKEFLPMVGRELRAENNVRLVTNIRQFFDTINETQVVAETKHVLPSSVGLPTALDSCFGLVDVAADGHCFFRAVDKLITNTENHVHCLRLLALNVVVCTNFWKQSIFVKNFRKSCVPLLCCGRRLRGCVTFFLG